MNTRDQYDHDKSCSREAFNIFGQIMEACVTELRERNTASKMVIIDDFPWAETVVLNESVRMRIIVCPDVNHIRLKTPEQPWIYQTALRFSRDCNITAADFGYGFEDEMKKWSTFAEIMAELDRCHQLAIAFEK